MSWMNEHQRLWRMIAVALLVVAFSGPWSFDRIHVPSPYPCSAPNVRLDENFCGLPLSILWFYSGFFGNLGSLVTSLRTGTMTPQYLVSAAWLILPLLPLFSTALVLVRGGERHWRRFHLVALGIGALAALFVALLGFSQAHWALGALWGIWLYSGLVATVLLLEVRAFPTSESE